jgi:amyloid beta A4 precursor protein-binding family B member 2
VRYLGQLELAESELEGVDRSQQALNRAMARLANNTGRDVLLELCDAELRVFDPPEAADGGEGKSEPLIREPVKRIRCWAVGSDNPRQHFPQSSSFIHFFSVHREFAFLAREPGPKGRLLCHVFRCEDPAKQVADALDQACAQLLQQQKRPDSLGSLGRRRTRKNS